MHKNCCCLFCFFETKLLLSFEVWCLFPEQQPPFPFCKTLVFIWVGQNWYAFKYKFNQPEIERHCTLLNYWTHCVYIIKWTTQSFPILKSIYIIRTAFRSYIDSGCSYACAHFLTLCLCQLVDVLIKNMIIVCIMLHSDVFIYIIIFFVNVSWTIDQVMLNYIAECFPNLMLESLGTPMQFMFKYLLSSCFSQLLRWKLLIFISEQRKLFKGLNCENLSHFVLFVGKNKK